MGGVPHLHAVGGEPAEGQVPNALALHMIAALEEFSALRAKLLRERLFGRELGFCEVRMALVRLAVTCRAEGRPLTLSRAVRMLRALGSDKKIRTEARLMQDVGVFLLVPATDGTRETLVLPSPRLVSYLNESMPDLLAFIHRVCEKASRL